MPEYVEARIRTVRIASMHWPHHPLMGGGGQELVEFRSSFLPRSRPIGQVPLGKDVADRVYRARRLTRWVILGLLPLIATLYALGGFCLYLSWSGASDSGRGWFLVFNGLAIVLMPLALAPGTVAVRSKTPRVVGEWLLLPAAKADMAEEAAALNPAGTIEIR